MRTKCFRRPTVCLMLALLCAAVSVSAAPNVETVKDTLVVGAYAETMTMFPPNDSTIPTIHMYVNLYETLLKMDAKGNIVPGLAESYKQLDPSTYRFSLKKGVKFHNGDTMKASDVIFSLKTIAKSVKASAFTGEFDVDRFEIVDDNTVILRTKGVYAPFLKILCYPQMSIFSEKFYNQNKARIDTVACGTGPFRLVKWNPDENVIMERFDGYHGELPKFKTLNIRVIMEENSRLLELETGGIDIMAAVPGVAIDNIKSNKKLALHERSGVAITFLALNFQKKFLTIPEVRQAIAHSVDVDALTKAIKMDAAAPAHSYLSASTKGAKLDLPPYSYNPQLAKKLLAKAGYTDGMDLSLSFYTSTDNRRIGEVLQAMMAESGIRLKLDEKEAATYTPFLNTMQQEAAVTTLNNTLNDPHQTLSRVGSKLIGKGGNRVNYQNPKADALLDAALSEIDDAKRMAVYDQLQQLLYNDTVWIPLFSEKVIFATTAKLKGFSLTFPAAYQNYASCYVVK